MLLKLFVPIALLALQATHAQDEQPVTLATTMVTDTDWLGNPITTPSTFTLEPERKAFQTCIFGCSSVTVPCSKETPGGSTVIVVLPLTIPCSLVKCPPCTTCVSTTVSITVCPQITTITPIPATATIFTTASSIPTARCQQMIEAAVKKAVVEQQQSPSVITVTRTRAPVGCPAIFNNNDAVATTSTIQMQSVCSTFVVCQASRRPTCPLPSLLLTAIEGTHVIDTLQAIIHQTSIISAEPIATSLDATNAALTSATVSTSVSADATSITADTQTATNTQKVTGMIAERLFQRNLSAQNFTPTVPSLLVVVLIAVFMNHI